MRINGINDYEDVVKFLENNDRKVSRDEIDAFRFVDLEDKEKIKAIADKLDTYYLNLKNNINKYPEDIMEILRRRYGLDKWDISNDQELNKLNEDEVFDAICALNRINSVQMKYWINALYGVELK